MALQIFGDVASRAFRVLWAARELGLDFEHVDFGFLSGEQYTPEFLTVNPNGRIPALRDGSFAMFESMAINLYLARRAGTTLAPLDLEEDALMMQWSFWAITELEGALLLLMLNEAVFAPEDRSADEVAAMAAKLQRPLGVLDRHLTRNPSLVGKRFTIADLNVAAVLTAANAARLDMSEFRHVERWLKQCLSRPAAAGHDALPPRLPRPPDLLEMLL